MASRILAGVLAAGLVFAAAHGALAQGGGGRGGAGSDSGREETFDQNRTGGGRGFQVEIDGCLRVGTRVVVTGPVPAPPAGGVSLVAGGEAVALVPGSWSEGWMQLTVPAAALPPGAEVELRLPDGRRIGTAATCGGGSGGSSGGGAVAAGDGSVVTGPVATGPDGRPEFVVAVPAAAAGAAEAALAGAGATVLRRRVLGALGDAILVFDLPDGLGAGGAQALLDAAAPGAVIAPNHLYGFAEGPRLYAAAMVRAEGDGCRLAGPVRIGVIDGPVDAGHPGLAGLAVRTHSFVEGRAAAPDHGTAVAALIAGPPGAGPYAGFAPGAEILAAEVFAADETADVERIAAGLDWLAGEGVRLANLSFAGPPNRVLERILAAASALGAVLVAAAGNDGAEIAALPAAAPGVIAVTAVDAAGRPYARANRGPHIAFAAPGVDLWAAKAGGGAYVSGTSFAAPIVTAFAGRLLARDPTLGAEAVRALLRAAAVDLGPPGHDPQFGWGLAQAPGC